MFKTKMKIKSQIIITLSAILLATSINATADTSPPFKLKQLAELKQTESDRFPGDPAEHKAVYMWNKSDPAYQHSILNSIQAMIKRYGDNVEIAVVAIGPGLHVLAKEPQRKVDALTYERVASFSKDYNVRWVACGNTMNSLHWKDKDMRPFAEYAEAGSAALRRHLMELQEEGYKQLVW